MLKSTLSQVHSLLLNYKKTIAVAESCSGGLTSSILTKTPGSSQYFKLGIVAYSNKSKENLLKIPLGVIAKKGAVCREVAIKLSKSVKKIAGSSFGIGITGIAGPNGGTHKKPIGTVFIAVSSRNKTICKKFLFKGSRGSIRKKSALKSLELLKRLLRK